MLDKSIKIHIVGGTGVMGIWLKEFLKSSGYNPTISDEKIKAIDLDKQEIVFISVPIRIAPKIILDMGKKTKEDCLIVDLSSIKSNTEKVLKELKQPALSLHFLFGPSVSSITNQKVVYNNFSNNPNAQALLELMKHEGAQLIEMDGQSHDFAMAHIQSLTHFINLSLAQILTKNKIGISGQVSTPVFLAQISSTLRVLSQNPKLLSEIQLLNSEFLDVVEQYLEIQKEMIRKIKNKETEKIENEFIKLRKNLESVSGRYEEKTHKKIKEIKTSNLRVGYLGPAGTFSNQAASGLFSEDKNELIASQDIYELFEMLSKDKTDLIVAPVENTIEGTVRETLDLLFEYGFKVIGKIDLDISQCLLSKENELTEIKRIISHPQALNQSRKFLEENLPKAIIETSSSTLAAIRDLEGTGVAIIGSSLAAKIYKLNILKEDIQNTKNNITRFYIIGKRDLLNLSGRTKTLLLLSIFNRVGVLRDILSVLADLSINLNKIESRPSGEKNWDYHFFVEVDISEDNPKFAQALNLLKQYCPKIIVLGKL